LAESDRGTELTEKQQRFVEEYLIDLNATQAAVRAGYSARNADKIGPRLVGKSGVAQEIAKRLAERSARTAVTQDYVIQRLRENVERAMQAEPVYDKEGNPTGEYRYEGNVANGALGLLGKHLAMFTEKHEVSVPAGTGVLAVPVPIDAANWALVAVPQQSNLLQQPTKALPEE
jgi:phage terminase small subunit